MVETSIGFDEDYVAHILHVCRLFGDLHQQPWQEGPGGGITWTAFLMVILEYQVKISRIKIQMASNHCLYLTITLLKVWFCKLGLSPG
jgi:hypothetical protein